MGDVEYIYYKYNGKREDNYTARLAEGYVIEIFKPQSIFLLRKHVGPILLYLFWFLFTCGKYVIYYVRDKKGKIIHFSHVMPRIFKYAFMKSSGIHIGPCWTHSQHRGKGVYPTILKKILHDYRSEDAFIFTQTYNSSSKRGIVKSNFSFFATGRKTKILGRYIITSSLI